MSSAATKRRAGAVALGDGVSHGDPVVLIHGLGGSSRTWDRVAPALRGTNRVVRVDLAGFGSARDAGARDHTVEQHANDVVRAIDRAGIDGPVILVGHSLGGLVATAVCERRPDRVGALVIVNSPPTVASRTAAASSAERLLRVPVLGPLLWRAMRPAQVRRGLTSAFAPGTDIPETWVEDVRRSSHAAFVGASEAIDRYLDASSLPDRLAAVEQPTTVVFGLQDGRVDPDTLRLYDPVDHVTTIAVPTAGHSPVWESPDAVVEAIRAAPWHSTTATAPNT